MATLYIKRKQDPFTIEDERARAVKNRLFGLNGAAKASPLDLVDLGVWSGQYGQISSIEIEGDKRRDEWTESVTKEYSDAELESFHKQMQMYMTKKVSERTKEEYESYDTQQFLVDKHAIKIKDYLGHPTVYVVLEDGKTPISLYENKLEQWIRWRERKEFGKKKRIEELEKVAATQ